jgi:MFS transporter, putative metabolite:H+ symporter
MRSRFDYRAARKHYCCSASVLMGELFPTSVRARGIGLVYSIDRLTAAFNSYLIGFILVRAGVPGVLSFIAGVSIIAMIVVARFGPRTRGLATEGIRNRGTAEPAQTL